MACLYTGIMAREVHTCLHFYPYEILAFEKSISGWAAWNFLSAWENPELWLGVSIWIEHCSVPPSSSTRQMLAFPFANGNIRERNLTLDYHIPFADCQTISQRLCQQCEDLSRWVAHYHHLFNHSSGKAKRHYGQFEKYCRDLTLFRHQGHSVYYFLAEFCEHRSWGDA